MSCDYTYGSSAHTSGAILGSTLLYAEPTNANPELSRPEELSEKTARKREQPLILIADDEPIITETLAAILSDEGYEVASARDGSSAVQEAIRLRPDIVLLDVAMPRLNGVDAAKAIMASIPQARVLLFSGQAETADLLAEARKTGYEFEVLAKPVKPQALLRALRNI
jgi:CheY-like chemotaxis protein